MELPEETHPKGDCRFFGNFHMSMKTVLGSYMVHGGHSGAASADVPDPAFCRSHAPYTLRGVGLESGRGGDTSC